jgi:hypothetical protein
VHRRVIYEAGAAEAATARFDALAKGELRALCDYYRLSRELNERHAERIRGLRFE